MARSLYFLGGLPRAGSTLIANLLVQNPRFHATATSGVLNLIQHLRVAWEKIPTFKAAPRDVSEAARMRVMRGVLVSYFGDVTRPVIFDKSRGWIGKIALAEKVMGRKVKVIAPVRDVRDVVASFEQLALKNVLKPTSQELSSKGKWETVEGRIDIWMARNGVVGGPYRQIREALLRGFGDRILFVDYDHLTRDPESQMKRIYAFLGEAPFRHDYENVQQVTTEDDEVWHMPGLHDIRPQVRPQPPLWPRFLPDSVAKKLPGREMWEKRVPPLPPLRLPEAAGTPGTPAGKVVKGSKVAKG